MCKYGILRILVTDNGTQFNNEEFRKYSEEWDRFAVYLRSSSTSQWARGSGKSVTTGTTPFMLAYGAEAVVPVEISHTSSRIHAYNAEENEEGKRLALDLIDEV
ncbi:uncharacterized protein LOC141685235 [Apium graveolens]|uniref:uncharacterized protein LOC141685235 n=1 Tax=Apium graveolens TaxID=4045 RepID=UPI003D7B8C26